MGKKKWRNEEIEIKLVVDRVSVLRGYCFQMAAGGLSIVKVQKRGNNMSRDS
jgi:hypothetical protein